MSDGTGGFREFPCIRDRHVSLRNDSFSGSKERWDSRYIGISSSVTVPGDL